MNDFISDGAEYLSSGMKTMKGASIDDIVQYLIGNRPDAAQREIVKDVFGISRHVPGVSAKNAAKVGRFAGRLAPAVGAIGNVVDVADILTGDESFGNKAMDAAAMGIGGTAGFFLGGGPFGASMGASAGKALSDGAQFLLGGGPRKTEEEMLQEALLKLNGGIS